MTWFAPDDTRWQPVSRSLIPARLIALWLQMLVPVGVLTVLTITGVTAMRGPWGVVLAAIVVLGLWLSWVVVRQVTAHAWCERDDDLVVRKGRVWRTVTVVPYGRMQYVEVQAGPLARLFKIATVQLHTASPGTDASIAGVPEAEAARLRDRLTERGEAQLAGL